MTAADPGTASWLQLTLAPGIGPASLRRLLGLYGLPEQILRLPRRELAQHLGPEAVAGLDSSEVGLAVDAAMRWLETDGHALITLADPGYPRLLLEIADPPPVLYCRGRSELLNRPSLGVVGSRNATAQGAANAEMFSRSFSAAGLTIVSGLAQGIDAAAHRGGLQGPGSTIAVLGTGVDIAYPRSNAPLAGDIAVRGLLVSEYPLGARALAHHFPRRNRVISGLASGCLVVEAALASGSLITARAAAEQGREVFAVPGSIHSPLSKGCHALIKSGAKLAESAEDVLSELQAIRPAPPRSRRSPPDAGGQSHPLLEHMGFDPVDVDALFLRSKIPVDQITAQLLQLELEGRITALPGGLYQRKD